MKKSRIKTGICSITFRQLSIAELVALVAKAGLDGIEWGGDVHVPPGALDVAREALARTRDAGLEVSSYGSYHKVLDAAGAVQEFQPVLESALALETNVIRIWAGCKGSDVAEELYRKRAAEEIRRIAEAAAACKVKVALEFHPKTLTDTNESTLALLKEVNHSNLYMYWQPIYWGPDMNYRLAGLDALRPRILNFHVFHWDYDQTCADFYGGIKRRPLAEGSADWKQYLATELPADLPHFALMEFVMDNSPEQFLKDAETLKSWLRNT
jgi:sugar phosphate isomerase/epimerase